MIIGISTVRLYAPWVHSLKEKRMVVKSITQKVRNKFNVSIAETDNQDVHQSVVISFACVVDSAAFADSVIDNIINFIECCTEAEIIKIQREIMQPNFC